MRRRELRASCRRQIARLKGSKEGLHNRSAGIEGLDVACGQKHGDPHAVSIAGVVRDDHGRPCLTNLTADHQVEIHPVHVAAARCSAQVVAKRSVKTL
jgi:hypothetical protein